MTAKYQEQPSQVNRLNVILLIVPLCWIVYANSLGNGFVFDDFRTVVNDPDIRTLNLTQVFSTWFRPVRTLSLTIDYWLWGLNPAGFHLTNVLIHSVNSFLIFLVAFKITDAARTSLFAALLFAVHPIQTDAVAYISGRRDILFALFYLAGFYAYIRFRESRRRWWLILCGTAFVLSVLTKEMGVTLPAVLLLWEIYRRWQTESELSVARQLIHRVRETIPAVKWELIIGGVIVAGLLVRYTLGTGRGLGSPRAAMLEYWGGSLWLNLLTVTTVYAHYLKQIFAPVTLIASYQGAFPIAQSLLEWRVLLSLALLFVILGVGFLFLKRDKLISFAIAFYFITLLPVSHLIPHHELVAEHYLYLSMFGISLAVGHLINRLAERSATGKKIAYVGCALLVLSLSARTIVRNRDWKDGFTLWSVTAQAVPLSPRAQYNLGVEYQRRGRLVEAMACFRKAIELDPNHNLAYNNLASVYMMQAKFEEALKILQQAVTIRERASDPALWGNPTRRVTLLRRNLAKCYLQLRQPENALKEAQHAITLLPIEPAGYLALGEIQELEKQIDAAMETYQKGLAKQPTSVDLRLALARLHSRNSRLDEAVKEWQLVLKGQPQNATANLNLGIYFLSKEETNRAVRHLRFAALGLTESQVTQAVREAIAPYTPPQSLRLMVQALSLFNLPERALAVCEEAVRQFPADRELRLELASLYTVTQKVDAAVAEWQTILKSHPNDFHANLNLGAYHLSKGDKTAADRYLNLALTNAQNDAHRKQVQAMINQVRQGQPHSHPGS
jgi:tetratricopeptide (TPR) repeat protein